MTQLHVLVLAGGSGTRLWPLSRRALPKHLLPLGRGGVSLLRDTVERLVPLGAAVHIVTAASQAPGCAAAVAGLELGGGGLIVEPDARGTGPALGLAVLQIAAQDPGSVICSVHADHAVADDHAYRTALVAAAGWAESTGGLVAVGLIPTAPTTGFGYIAVGSRQPGPWRLTATTPLQGDASELPAYRAAGFVEKPPAALAQEYLAGGRHLWNTGLFAWTAAGFISELERFEAGLSRALREIVVLRAAGRDDEVAELYRALPAGPIEPLLLERSGTLTVVRAGFAWSDLGSWADLATSRASDPAGNVVTGDACLVAARDSMVWSNSGRLVALVGADGLAVVDTPDAVLVVPLGRAQEVKAVVATLDAQGRASLL